MTFLSPTQIQSARRLIAGGEMPEGPNAQDAQEGAPRPEGSALPSDPVALRQLRHQTKNALQRIIGQVSQHTELRRTRQGRRLIEDVQRRIVLSARISDALFGLTRAPGPLHVRLHALGESMVELLGDPDQVIHLDVTAAGECPAALEGVVLRVAHEFLGNAVKHGMHARIVGRIQLRLHSGEASTRLQVVDDGWGCGAAPVRGEGLDVAEALAGRHDGRVRLRREGDTTIGELELPHPPALPAA